MTAPHRPTPCRRSPCRRLSRPAPFPPSRAGRVLFHALGMLLLFGSCLVLWAALYGAFALGWRYGAVGTVLGVVCGLMGAGLVGRFLP